ncbi:uncharacterized protein LOC131066244 isoform X1 [Cryptomeria japonica]|uniref:uncharacterized protein LOC131066244 isoform X1 n=1 Tax=Cryptomeria japonica TaxID=3369 RepID=UPI0025ACAB11|nr:uncharacterized protein LOC131066244 isoform X1 [Cryptomeria japonica]
MMGNLDWGGTCFARYKHGHGHVPTAFISKTDEIMSKYRPIAPRPTPVTSNACESNSNCKPNSDSALGSRSKFTTRKGKRNHYTESGVARPNRTRRKGSSYSKTPSPRGTKRLKVGPNKRSDLAGSERSTHIVGFTVQPSSIAADRPTKIVHPFDGASSVEKLNAEDLGCMEKAAAIAPTEGSSMPYKKTTRLGGLTIIEVMNSIGGVGAENPAKSMEAVPEQTTEDTQCGCGSPELLVFPVVSNSQRQEEEEKNEKKLVTLPFLPETPSLHKSPALGSSESNSPSTDPKSDMPDASSDKREIQLRLFGINFIQKRDGPCQTSKDESPKPTTFVPSVDSALLDQMYSVSVDPFILLLDSDRKDVLWFNPAYVRMVKAIEERNSNGYQPLIMTPTPLACYIFKEASQGAVNLKAILWGFVNKFNIPETASGSNNETSINREHTLMSQASSSSAHFMQRSPNDAMSGMPPTRESLSPVENVVVMPQANRPVGSIINIEYIKEANQHISPLCKTMDEIHEQIERETFPALISDSTNKVKWTNSAYKKMVGQPECSWLKSTGGLSNDKFDVPSNSWINGEVVLNDKIPLPVSALKCCARIQWTNIKGKKSSLRAPCEVYNYISDLSKFTSLNRPLPIHQAGYSD